MKKLIAPIGTSAANALLLTFAVAANMAHAGPLLEEVHTLSRAAPAVERSFTIAAAGDYDVVLTDLAAPGAFTSLQAIVTHGAQVVSSLSAPGAVRFAAAAEPYQLHIFGRPDAATGSGAVGLQVLPAGSSTPVYDFADAINSPPVPADPTIATLHTQFTVTVPGTYNVNLTDFAFPVALTTLMINVVAPNGSSVFGSPPTAPGMYSFTAAAATYDLFVITKVASPPDSGSYGLEITDGTHSVYSDARAVSTQSSIAAPGATYAADVTAGGSYRVTLTDFQFPVQLQSVQLNVTQGGVSLGTLTAAGNLDVTLGVGRVFVSTVAQPTPANANGLYGVQLRSVPAGVSLIDVTQGAGPLFDVRTVDVTVAGSYQVVLSDLNFPATFSDLALAVTRGTDRIALIFGGGTFAFNAAPGRYFLNFIAAPNATAQAGTYGLSVDVAPPAPVVTLAANPTSLASGGTTVLTWSTTGATACTASGAWTGSRGTSGTETSAAINANSTFTLTCTGPGGSAANSASVTIAALMSSGGGGSLQWQALLLLIALLLGTRRCHAISRLSPQRYI